MQRLLNVDEENHSIDIKYQSDEQLFCQLPDITIDCHFDDYRTPNEGTPIGIQSHLQLMEKGWIVSTGTERSFYNLLLSSEDKCEGLIIRDINPKVKAYCDYLVLLLCCSNDKDDFCYLLNKSHSPELLKREIISKLSEIQLSQVMISYFITHYDLLAQCYLPIEHICKTGNNFGVEYQKDDDLFNKLQKYAREGKIIPTVGDINDLSFAYGRKIAIIDTSNISDYTSIKPNGYGDLTPRLIFTDPDPYATSYYSGLYNKPDKDQIKTIQKYMDLFVDSISIEYFQMSIIFSQIHMSGYRFMNNNDIFNKLHISCFNEENCLKIKNYLIYLINSNKAHDIWFIVKRYFTKSASLAIENIIINGKCESNIPILNNLFILHHLQIDTLIKKGSKKEENNMHSFSKATHDHKSIYVNNATLFESGTEEMNSSSVIFKKI